MSKRPTVNTKCVADSYANKQCERIIEFSAGDGTETGGLISFRRMDDGTLHISLYRTDGPITVTKCADSRSRR